jgi:CTP:molybdopterin cytidylyltransferase MocA
MGNQNDLVCLAAGDSRWFVASVLISPTKMMAAVTEAEILASTIVAARSKNNTSSNSNRLLTTAEKAVASNR